MKHKRLSLWLLMFVMLFSLLPVSPAHAADYDPNRPEILETDHLNCEAAILMEIDSGEVIFEKNSKFNVMEFLLIYELESNIDAFLYKNCIEEIIISTFALIVEEFIFCFINSFLILIA